MKTKTGQHQGDKQAQSGSTASSELESRIQKSREAIANIRTGYAKAWCFTVAGFGEPTLMNPLSSLPHTEKRNWSSLGRASGRHT